jgi:hypothetical protein
MDIPRHLAFAKLKALANGAAIICGGLTEYGAIATLQAA